MLSKILERKYEIVGILSLFSGMAGCYFYSKNKGNGSFHEKTESNQSNLFHHGQLTFESKQLTDDNRDSLQKWSSLYSEYYFDKNLQSRKVLDHLDAQGISVQTIYKYSPLIAVDQFRKFTRQIRRRRRLIRTVNEDQYIKLIFDYEQEVDELLQRSRQEIIYQCEIDPDEFSSMKVIFQATEDLTSLIRDAKKMLKNVSLSKVRSISKTVLQKIVNEEICFIKSKLYERLRIKLQNVFFFPIQDLDLCQDQILKIIQALIDDIIYQKFGYEREQIEHSLNEEWKVELIKEIKELKKTRAELESQVGNINLLSQQSDAESERQKMPLSQGMTRSGANSSFVQDEVTLN